MPGPSLISGVAGSVHSEAYQGPQLGEQMVQMAEAFTRIKQAEQAGAMQKYKVMLESSKVLPIEAGALRKVAKKAGMPLPSDETIAAIAAVGKEDKAKKGQPNSTGTQQSTAGKSSPDAAAAEATKKYQDNMTPQQGLQGILNSWYAKTKAANEKDFQVHSAEADAAIAKADKDKILDQTVKLIMDPTTDHKTRQEAMGRMALGAGVKLDMPTLSYTQADDKAKQTMLGFYRGNMSEGERAKISTDMSTALIGSGISASTALRAGDAWSRGEPLSSDLQKELGTPTWEQLGKEAKFAGQLAELGLTGSELKAASQAATQTGNLFAALPPRFTPYVQQELNLKQQEVRNQGVIAAADKSRAETASKQAETSSKRETRLEKESQRKYDLNVAKLTVLAADKANEETLKAYHLIIEQQKNGIKVDDKQFNAVMDKLQTLHIEDPKEFTKFLTGAPSNPVPASDNPVNDALGAPQ